MTKSWSLAGQNDRSGRVACQTWLGGTLVTALITSIFAARTVEAVCVILSFGARAYFSERLQLSDWKHSIGLLSNGQVLPWLLIFLFVPGMLVMWAALILLTEFIAGVLVARLKRYAPWVTRVCRCIGGIALLGLRYRYMPAAES